MEEEFLRKYYSVEKTTSVRKVIREFTQGSSETFQEAWERLRDLTRECLTISLHKYFMMGYACKIDIF